MEKEFVPYEESLTLRELGFDEPCLGIYKKIKNKNPFKLKGVAKFEYRPNSVNSDFMVVPTAPTWGAAFRWFREKYNLFGYSYPNDYQTYGYRIVEVKSPENKELIYDWGTNNTNEEAELACLRKLIEIVKK